MGEVRGGIFRQRNLSFCRHRGIRLHDMFGELARVEDECEEVSGVLAGEERGPQETDRSSRINSGNSLNKYCQPQETVATTNPEGIWFLALPSLMT